MIHNESTNQNTFDRRRTVREDSRSDVNASQPVRRAEIRASNGSDEALDEWSVILLHEVKQPLTASMNLLEAAIRQAAHEQESGENADLVRMLQTANSQLVKAVDLLRQLKHFGSNGGASPVPHDLNQIVREALGTVLDRSDESQLHMKTALSDSPVIVNAHESALMQAIINVLQNAIDAMEWNVQRPHVVNLHMAVNHETVTLTIHNAGPPLSDHTLDRLFDPFFTTKDQGTGLGLAIARRVLEQYGGSMHVCNAEDGGVRCEMILPVGKETEDE